MGVLYSVQPLSREITEWLDAEGIPYPRDVASRFPTGREIEFVLGRLSSHRIQYNDNGIGFIWQATVTREVDPEHGLWTQLNISEYTGRDNENALWFEKGHPELILDIICRIAAFTGPLVLIPDTGCSPVAISEDSSVEEIVVRWDHTRA